MKPYSVMEALLFPNPAVRYTIEREIDHLHKTSRRED
jgi:hypothetical protein